MNKIAIDFGTTRTKIATLDETTQQPHLIHLGRENSSVIPSLFYIPKHGSVRVGDDAMEAMKSDPAGVVRGLKMDLHRHGKIRINGKRFKRKELASKLFQWIREQCNDQVSQNGPFTECILSVPPSFTPIQRESIYEAAVLGGFKKATLIEEPVAAAKHWLSSESSSPEHIIVCDIGGGTTDFALVKRNHDDFLISSDLLPTGVPVGGNDLDDNIWSSLKNENITHDKFPGFLILVRRAKEWFAERIDKKKTYITYGPEHVEIPRNVVEACSQQFVEEICIQLKKFLHDAKALNVPEVIQAPLLLVGGGKDVIGMKEALEDLWPTVYTWKNAEYGTVLGCLIAGEEKTDESGEDQYFQATVAARNGGFIADEEVETLIAEGRRLNIESKERSIIEIRVLGFSLNDWFNAQTYFDKAIGYWTKKEQTQNLDKVIDHCIISNDFCKYFPYAYWLKALALESKKKYLEAEEAISEYIQLDGSKKSAYFRRGRIRLAQCKKNQFAQAHHDFTIALSKSDNTIPKLLDQPINDADCYKFRAYASYRLSNNDECVSDLEKLLVLVLDDTSLSKNQKIYLRFVFHSILGKVWVGINPQKAIETFKETYSILSYQTSSSVNINPESKLANIPDWQQWFQSKENKDDLLDLTKSWLLDAIIKFNGKLDRNGVQLYYEITKSEEEPWILNNGQLLENTQSFLTEMASVLAENSDVRKTEKCLRRLWEKFPDTSFKHLMHDIHLKKIISKTNLAPSITQKIDYRYILGDDVAIKNQSQYTVTDVNFTLTVRGYKGVQSISHKINKLKAEQLNTFTNVKFYTGIRGTSTKKGGEKFVVSCKEQSYF